MGAQEITNSLDIKKEITTETESEKKEKINDSFYTNSLSFTQSDFDDFNDLKEDMASSKIIINILIVLVVIAFIVGIVVLLNGVLKLGLF